MTCGSKHVVMVTQHINNLAGLKTILTSSLSRNQPIEIKLTNEQFRI